MNDIEKPVSIMLFTVGLALLPPSYVIKVMLGSNALCCILCTFSLSFIAAGAVVINGYLRAKKRVSTYIRSEICSTKGA